MASVNTTLVYVCVAYSCSCVTSSPIMGTEWLVFPKVRISIFCVFVSVCLSLLPPAYVVRRERNVFTRVCPSVCPPPHPGLATRRAVCVLRSRRKTFLFPQENDRAWCCYHQQNREWGARREWRMAMCTKQTKIQKYQGVKNFTLVARECPLHT